VLGLEAQTPDGLPAKVILHWGRLEPVQLKEVLTRLAQYRLVEQVDDHWRIQVELTRQAFVGFLSQV
jgi:hypothetical protein